MPSPFPGVDPYLESQYFWEEFHSKFINNLQEAIGDLLPPGYEARIEERVSLVVLPDLGGRHQVQPDVMILQRDTGGRAPGEGATATAVGPVRLRLATQRVEEVKEHRVEVRRRPGRTLVAVVELLSPSNKEAPGQHLYLEKRLDLIRQPVHLVEIDLLVAGTRLPMDDPMPPGDFFAYVSRSEDRPECEVYPWGIRQPLPNIAVPLSAPDADARVDLAALFALTYDRGRYRQSIDYDAPLSVPLAREDRAWAEGIARTVGER